MEIFHVGFRIVIVLRENLSIKNGPTVFLSRYMFLFRQ